MIKAMETYINNPFLIFPKLGTMGLAKWIPNRIYLKGFYRAYFHKKCNLRNPKSFNEKLQWLKLHDHKNIYTTMVDKYEVKGYVSGIIGDEYIVPAYGVWNSFDEIDFESFPDKFVLKCTHDSGGLYIVDDKSKFDSNDARTKIENSLKNNFYWLGREWPYKNVKPRIIAEKFLEMDNVNEKDKTDKKQKLIDYKFYCFDGEPKFLYLSQGLDDHATARISFVSLDWKPMPFFRTDYKSFEILPKKPDKFEDMLEICRKLAKGMNFLRVDLYEVNGKVYFSELTFYPCSGFMPFNDERYDLEVGKMLLLPHQKK